jgi:hypothetical protein
MGPRRSVRGRWGRRRSGSRSIRPGRRRRRRWVSVRRDTLGAPLRGARGVARGLFHPRERPRAGLAVAACLFSCSSASGTLPSGSTRRLRQGCEPARCGLARPTDVIASVDGAPGTQLKWSRTRSSEGGELDFGVSGGGEPGLDHRARGAPGLLDGRTVYLVAPRGMTSPGSTTGRADRVLEETRRGVPLTNATESSAAPP